MGGVCSVCKQAVAEVKISAKVQPSSPRAPPKKEQHDGQFRARLLVKEGGFALKNFHVSNPGKLEDFFEVHRKKLGEGGFGSVRKGKDKRSGIMCAIKTIRKSAAAEVARMKEEIEIMRLLDHPNIVRFIESFEDKRCIYIALELCEGGELFERICKAGSFNEEVAAKCVKQMLLAVNYLHQNLIMHRDLKPENWLLASREEINKAPLKLIDFGISRKFETGLQCRTKAGTPNYVAPEVLAGRYDEKVDIWSIGVITYVMLSGSQPFAGKSIEQVMQKVKAAVVPMEGGSWKSVTADGKAFIKACLRKAPSMRLAASQALNHNWFNLKVRETVQDISDLDVTGLRAFGRMNQLKRACVTVIATQMTQAKITKLQAMFMAMDKNNDGTLSIAEITRALKDAGVQMPGNIDDVLSEVDSDGSGVIDYTEFLAATMDKKEYHQESTVWNAFKKFDLDGSGSIDIRELGKVLGDDSVKEAMQLEESGDRMQELFNSVDVNGDGMIDFVEFFAMMKARAEDSPRPSARKQIRLSTSPTGGRRPSKSMTTTEQPSPRATSKGVSYRPRIGISQQDQEPPASPTLRNQLRASTSPSSERPVSKEPSAASAETTSPQTSPRTSTRKTSKRVSGSKIGIGQGDQELQQARLDKLASNG